MKALLVEDPNRKAKHSAIILLPSGAIELVAGEPANVVIEKDEESYSIRFLTAHDVAVLKVVKEVDVRGHFLVEALKYRNARAEHEKAEAGFRDKLLNEMITPNCDALTFLDMGSVVL